MIPSAVENDYVSSENMTSSTSGDNEYDTIKEHDDIPDGYECLMAEGKQPDIHNSKRKPLQVIPLAVYSEYNEH